MVQTISPTTNKQIQTPILIIKIIIKTWILIQGTHYGMPKSNIIEWLIALLLFQTPMSTMMKFMGSILIKLVITQTSFMMG